MLPGALLWGAALAHTPLAVEIPYGWNFDPLVAAPMMAAALAYTLGLGRLWRRAGRGRGVAGWRAAAFALGLGVLAAALLSPLEALAEASFAAHMTQHVALLVIAPPLLVLGQPLAPFIMALPIAWRGPAGRWLRQGRPGRLAGWLSRLPAAVALFGLMLWLWHAPALYETAIRNDGVHIVQHLTLLAAALLFWWSIVHCGRGGRFGYGSGALGLFLTALHAKFLGILILLAPAPLYDVYGTALPWNLTPLEDQQAAGMIMLLPMDAVFLVGTLVMLGLWLANAGRVGRAAPDTGPGHVGHSPTYGADRRKTL